MLPAACIYHVIVSIVSYNKQSYIVIYHSSLMVQHINWHVIVQRHIMFGNCRKGNTLRQNRADTSWSKTPIAITGRDVKKTLQNDKNQSLYAGCAENEVYASNKKIVKPNVMFLQKKQHICQRKKGTCQQIVM